MNIFDLISFSASFICLSLGIIVYSLNRKARLNKIFLLAILAAFFYSFTTVMMWQAPSTELSYIWNKMGTIWPFFAVLVLNFALVFTESKWLNNKLTYLVLYLPAVAFWLIDLNTNLINAPPVMQYWGYNDVASGTWLYYTSTIWAAVLPIIAFISCFLYYRKAKEDATKKRREFVAIGFGIPVVAFILTNMLPRSLGVSFPNLGIVATLFFSSFVGYAIVKHELFTFDAAMAAENIISTMPDALVLADMKGKIVRVNEGLFNLLEYPKEELIGKSIIELCPQNEKKRCSDTLKGLVEKRIIRNQELKFATKLGDSKSVLFSGSVVRSKTGREIGLTCVIHDITEHEKMEERLQKAEGLAAIGKLAGQIGHDLRNPLTSIKSGAYFLNKKGKNFSDSEKSILKAIDDSVEDSNRIINSLIDYSWDLRLEMSTCTPNSIFSKMLNKMEIPDRIQLVNKLTSEPQFLADADKIENVFERIIKNAIEAMPDHGVLELRNTQTGSNVEIEFTDSGIGLSKDVVSKIFSPLVTTKAKGMGLGLAICKRIVDAHEGRIRITSAEGKGTTVTVELPIKPKIEFNLENNFLEIED